MHWILLNLGYLHFLAYSKTILSLNKFNIFLIRLIKYFTNINKINLNLYAYYFYE